MNSEQIKRAIARIRDFGLHHAIKDLPHSTYTVEAFELAIECMEKELERQENKALTLSELEEWEGNPVYVISNDGMLNLWEVVIYAREKNSIKCLQSHYNLLDYNFYKHKPTEGWKIMEETTKKDVLLQILKNQEVIMSSLISCASIEENIYRVRDTINPEMKKTAAIIDRLSTKTIININKECKLEKG